MVIYENLCYEMHKAVVEFTKLNISQIQEYIEINGVYYIIKIKEISNKQVKKLKEEGYIQDD